MPHGKIRFAVLLWTAGLILVLAVGAYLAMQATQRYPIDPQWQVPGGDPKRGRQMIVQYGCGACHVIPGMRAATGRVGPRLVGLKEQMYIAGVLPNTPENMVFWIQHPQEASPRTAMPNLQITESEAKDIAAYLYGASE